RPQRKTHTDTERENSLCDRCERCARLSSRGRSEADRAAHTGSTEPAVAVRILLEILLVVILGVVELRRGQDLRGDRAMAGCLQPLLVRIARAFRRAPLLVVEVIDAGTVLRADVVPLPHAL